MIEVGVIGAGHWGPNLIRNFNNGSKSRVAKVVDRDTTRLEQVRGRFPDVQVSANADDILDDPALEAVVIATPTTTHYGLAKKALQRGKHVLVEKPITDNAAQALELCELAERSSLILMVGHVFLYNVAVQRVKDYIHDGTLGRIFYISMIRTNLGPIRADVNAAWDLASHDISIVNYWLGTGALSVSSTGGNWINRGIEDAVFATLEYPGDVLVNLHVSWLNPRKARDITVVGAERMLTFDDMNLTEPVRMYDKRVTDTPTVPGYVDSFASFRASIREGNIVIPNVSIGEPLRTQCEHFLACVTTKTAPRTGGKEGLAVVRTLEAMTRSMRARGTREAVQ